MKMKYVVAVLLIFILLAIGCTPPLKAYTEYNVELSGLNHAAGKAIQREDEWYISSRLLLQAFGIQTIKTDDGEMLRMYTADEKGLQRVEKPIYYRDEVVVLMYHHITSKPRRSWVITPGQFEVQIQEVLRAGFEFITIDQYIDYMLHNKPVPPNAVLLTFDDGYASFYTDVFPILKRYGINATNFVIVNTIENDEIGSVKKLTWEQMREMKKAGMSFYSHTYDSHKYAPMNKERTKERPMLIRPMYREELKRVETRSEYLARVKQDLLMAEQKLKQELGNTKSIIAFPYGAYNKDVLNICKQLGIDISFTVKPGINNREQRNGYRINGGDQKIEVNELIERMAHRGEERADDKRNMVWRNSVSRERIVFKQSPIIQNNQVFVPMNEVVDLLNIQPSIDHKGRTITLSLSSDDKRISR
ncbi:polysaccharide deacetylase family protein [Paenibacillus sp. SC116]|uniref:polysaccharide deacetylase family protein n=1 Tax=Paenibacillus sp. SC116 TaxID=2968986 RepID=UPI00215B63BB|nr:polysaccharide deacetylase family protein [Paenibacillus sp. SC116]MCR8844880.1 polysaccharide deacetylase family protein [Paenibacillus sp. SC116]